MDWHLYVGLGVLALGIAGVAVLAARPARGAASGAIRGVYGFFNYRPLVKPFDKRAREIYDDENYDERSRLGPNDS